MNPDTNKLEKLRELFGSAKATSLQEAYASALEEGRLVRPNGEPVPQHWAVFQEDEHVVVKDYTFRVAYMNESTLVLEPVSPVVAGDDK